MGAVMPLARSEPAAIRTAWPDGSSHFPTWRCGNLDLLKETVGLDAMLEGREVQGGPFSYIPARERAANRLVPIENQCPQTDHRPLGQIRTCVAGLEASIATSAAESFGGEHPAAIDGLGRVTSEEAAVFGVEVKLIKGGRHHVPCLDVIAKPNNRPRVASKQRRKVKGGRAAQIGRDYWSATVSRLFRTMPELRNGRTATDRFRYVGAIEGAPDCQIRQDVSVTGDRRLCAYHWISGRGAKDVCDILLEACQSRQQQTELPIIFDRMEELSSASIAMVGPDAQPGDNAEASCQHASWFLDAMDARGSEIARCLNDLTHCLETMAALQSKEAD